MKVQCLHCGHFFEVDEKPKEGFLCSKCSYLEKLRAKTLAVVRGMKL